MLRTSQEEPPDSSQLHPQCQNPHIKFLLALSKLWGPNSACGKLTGTMACICRDHNTGSAHLKIVLPGQACRWAGMLGAGNSSSGLAAVQELPGPIHPNATPTPALMVLDKTNYSVQVASKALASELGVQGAPNWRRHLRAGQLLWHRGQEFRGQQRQDSPSGWLPSFHPLPLSSLRPLRPTWLCFCLSGGWLLPVLRASRAKADSAQGPSHARSMLH